MRWLYISLCILCSLSSTAVEKYSNLSDSLFKQNHFVIYGHISKKFRDNIRFTVTAPLPFNTTYNINTSSDGHFFMTVPMNGVLQEIYLRIDGVITIPVCANDTIMMTISDDDISLKASSVGADRDLQFALLRHRKTRRQQKEVNQLYNSYLKQKNTGASAEACDSILSLATAKASLLLERHNILTDTFIINNGPLHNEEYFRVSAYCGPLHFFASEDWFPSVTAGVYRGSDTKILPFREFDRRLLIYPSYRSFMNFYLGGYIDRANKAYQRNESTADSRIRNSMLADAIAPDTLTAELYNCHSLALTVKYEPYEKIEPYASYLCRKITTPGLRAYLDTIVPEAAHTAPGRPAPQLFLKDIHGNKLSLESFRGKYLHLDLWGEGCGPCISEFRKMKILHELLSPYKNEIELVTVCVNNMSPEKLKTYADKYAPESLWTVLNRRKSDKCYDAKILPTYILIDPVGRIVEFNTSRYSELIKQIESGDCPLIDMLSAGRTNL